MDTLLRIGLGNAAMAALLAVLAAAAGRLLGRRPAIRHALWLLVLLKLMTPPLTVVPVAWPALPGWGAREAILPLAAEPEPTEVFLTAGPGEFEIMPPPESPASGATIPDEPVGRAVARGVAVVWLSGAVLMLAVTGLRVRRWHRVLDALVPAPRAIDEQVEALAARMGLAHGPGVWWSPGPGSPMLWAFGARARLIVPESLWERLDDRQRTTLLVHELAHLRRRDHWVRLLELLVTACYWWLPLVWIARRALREAEEQCCDAWVVWACPDKIRNYAETLLETVEFLSESRPALPLAASGFGQVHHLKRRISMIMQGTTPRALGWSGMLGMFGLSAVLLPLAPSWAEEPAAGQGWDELAVATAPADAPVRPDGGTAPHLKVTEKRLQRFAFFLRDDDPDEAAKGPKEEDTVDRAKAHERLKLEFEKYVKQLYEAQAKVQAGKIKMLKEVPVEAREAVAKALKELKGLKELEGIAIPEAVIQRARSEVERARAELQAAERRLAKLQGGSAVVLVPNGPGGLAIDVDAGNKDAPEGKLGTHVERRYTVRRRLGAPVTKSERDRRIAEIEERLEQLVNEVKSLRERPAEAK